MPRDEFSEAVKRAVALRAGHRCSFDNCSQQTVGPSAESDTAVTNVGEAAHITAASSGPGARRFDGKLSPEERASIGNAIWLCAHHATLIDRDETTFTAERLREMKRQHEHRMKLAVHRRGGSGIGNDDDLIALGPDIIVVGSLSSGSDSVWEFRFTEFLDGDLGALVSYCDAFETQPASDRYILVNELADGRSLSAPPTWRRGERGLVVTCSTSPRWPRIRAQDLGSDFKLGPDHDLLPTMETVSGVDAFPQKVMTCLSMGKGEWFMDRGTGSRLSEYHLLFSGSPWLDRLIRLEVIRLASIPRVDSVTKKEYLPLHCVEKVGSFSFLEDPTINDWNKVAIDLEVNGLGRWTRELEVYLPSARTEEEDPFSPNRIAAPVNQMAFAKS